MRRLVNPIRNYAWGSHTAIATLQGRPSPTEQPEAELWMGAHPTAPSVVGASLTDGVRVEAGSTVPAVVEASSTDGVSLKRLIDQDPVGELGETFSRRFDGRLPFLLKVLAAAQPLSLQVHPDAAQARTGFAAEDEALVRRDAPNRNYVDPFHKPELLVAVDEFEALCGFRDPSVSLSVIESLEVPELEPLVAALRTGTVAERLRHAVEVLTGWPHAERPTVVAAVAAAACRALSDPAARQLGVGPAGAGVAAAAYSLVVRLAALYPADLGVVIALLLHQVRLRPGQAVFMPAGHLHAYVHGVGIEVMAASDNVLRGGLTSKYVDVAELVRILRFEVHGDPVLEPEVIGPGIVTWPVPASEFALVKATVRTGDGGIVLPGTGPRIVICAAGVSRLDVGGVSEVIRSGESVYVSAAEPAIGVTGDGVVFEVSPNQRH